MQLASIIKDNKLIPEKEWIKHINSLKCKGKITKTELKKQIIDSIKKRIPSKRFFVTLYKTFFPIYV